MRKKKTIYHKFISLFCKHRCDYRSINTEREVHGSKIKVTTFKVCCKCRTIYADIHYERIEANKNRRRPAKEKGTMHYSGGRYWPVGSTPRKKKSKRRYR